MTINVTYEMIDGAIAWFNEQATAAGGVREVTWGEIFRESYIVMETIRRKQVVSNLMATPPAGNS